MSSLIIAKILGVALVLVVFAAIVWGVTEPPRRARRRRERILRNPPPLPPARGDELLARLQRACRDADLATIHRETSAMVGQWDRRSYYLRGMQADLPRAREAIDAWVASSPTDPLARLLKGVAHLAWGWEARGTGMSETVSGEGWKLLKERLRVAKSELEEAARLDPRDPHPWSTLIAVGLGLGESDAHAEHAFREAIARDPWHFDAHDRRCESLKQKWSRKPHAALEFARDVAQRAPVGGDLPMLVVDALIEEWLSVKEAQGNEAGKHFRDSPAFRTETRVAMDRSILHPAHRDGPGWALLGVNIGAYMAWLHGDQPLLRDLLARLGDKAGVLGWYVSESKKEYFIAKAKLDVGLL